MNQNDIHNIVQESLKTLFTNLIANQQPIKIIVSAKEIKQSGWVATDIDSLSFLAPPGWDQYFALVSITAIMAEYIGEDLAQEQGLKADQPCSRYLQGRSYRRLALPDGLHSRQGDLNWACPQEHRPDADDHKLLYNYWLLEDILTTAGFEVKLLEYFDETDTFYYQEWNPHQGLIKRSQSFDPFNNPSFDYDFDHQVPATFAQEYSAQCLAKCGSSSRNTYYTSIVLDAWKIS